MQVLLKTLTLALLLWLMIYIYDSMQKCTSIEIYFQMESASSGKVS